MDIKNVVVIGGGVLGSQIAYQSAYKGFDVTIWLRSDASIERSKPKLERLKGIYNAELASVKERLDGTAIPHSRGLLDNVEKATAADIDALIANANKAFEDLVLTTDLAEAVKDADIVIEALAEDPAQKTEFYTKLAPLMPKKTILVTNSSTLLPSHFAEVTGRPAKYMSLHFANNIWKSNTAEVMGHAGTDKAVYDAVAKFAGDIGMVPLLLKKEQPGYILNSMLVPFLNSAEMLLAKDVADPETIDKTWKLGTGAPLGPFQILDIVGLTTAYNIVVLNPEAQNPESIPGKIAALLKEKIDAGKTGINAGEGFYKYN